MVSKMPYRKYGYYRDDQIVFLVTHESNLIADDQLKQFSTDIALDLKGGAVKEPAQVFSFPKLTEQERKRNQSSVSADDSEFFMSAFSIINCNIAGGPEDPTDLMNIIRTLNEKFQGQTLAGMTIQGVAPNWLASVASQGAGTGGGPRPPRHFHGNRRTALYRFNDLMTSLHTHGLSGDGTGVDVVILDTAPSGHDLVAAPKEWPDHPIISSLLGPKGKLHFYPAAYPELLRLGNTSLNSYDHKLTDHGLFVAGIIHSIAPKTEIHLIEVMNHCGVGDLLSIIQGLQKVRNEIYDPKRKLVINCSWILEMPCDDLHCRALKEVGDPDADFERAVLQFSKLDQGTPVMLDFLFHQFYALGRQAIAAAGNDGIKADGHPIASRYPAALASVTEVATSPKSWQKSGAGNEFRRADSKPLAASKSKVAIRFGSQDGTNEEEVLGVYIGEFPDGTPNLSKWAWWSGTSFATPVLTGAIAAVLSSSAEFATTQDAIEKLSKREIIAAHPLAVSVDPVEHREELVDVI